MLTNRPEIDPYLFELQFAAFSAFVEEKASVKFVSFASHPYTEEQEGYKYKIHSAAREALAFQAWKKSDIGKGEIISSTIEAIETKLNNLVKWQLIYGKEARPHHPLYLARSDPAMMRKTEECLFKLYHQSFDEESFAELLGIFGKKYSLLAYLFFLKDRSKYLPIATTFFDRAFSCLGAQFKTKQSASWENYGIYLRLIADLKTLLSEKLLTEVTLLDAHSFAWMLAAQMQGEGKLAKTEEYLALPVSERDAIIKARIGQGKFRDSLINYWARCAVTGCETKSVLRASHIKPWSKSSLTERLSLYNGLLLSPNLDACFDSGLISFDEAGQILISDKLDKESAKALSIHEGMCLEKMDPLHNGYLKYHRENIFCK